MQDLIKLHGRELCRMILQDNAHVYVCGNARYMAKGFKATFSHVLTQHHDLRNNNDSSETILDALKKNKRWLEDVW